MEITNEHNIPLLLGVWLLSDTYDYVHKPNYISATSLMKPLKEIILSKRVEKQNETTDLSDLLSRSLGTAIHDAVEKAWTSDNLATALQQLGIRPDAVEVNPKEPDKTKTQIYIEQRAFREIGGFTLGGKYDAVIEGIVHDIKSTSAWSWVKGTRDSDYQLQGSIYRWLNPDKITEDFIRVCFVFTDWQKANAGTVEGYPTSRSTYKDIPLLSLEDTEKWIKQKLGLLKNLIDVAEEEIPPCSDAEVWLEKPIYKYYANPAKTSGRSTKNFENYKEALAHLESAGKGTILTTPPTAKKCPDYCSAFLVCKQKDKYTTT